MPYMPNGSSVRDPLGSYGSDGPASAFNAMTPSPYLPSGAPILQIPDSRPSLERQVSVNQATVTELANLRSTVNQHGRAIQQLQCDVSVLIAGNTQVNPGMTQTAGPAQGLGRYMSPAANTELDTLREENRKMRERLATIASAMGIAGIEPPADDSLNSLDMRTTTAAESSLGKRKRIEDDQLPTPHSTQDSNRSREVSFAGPYFQAIQSGADFSLEGEIVMGDDTPWNDYAAQSSIPNLPTVVSQPSFTAPPTDSAHGAVEFSDDEIAALHFPSVGSAPPAQETIQQYKARMRVLHGLKPEPLQSGSNEIEPHGYIDMDQAEHWSRADVERLIEEEKMPPPPKEPREPKERIQSTEKYLNVELEEYGLTEWIGKDKRDPAYKVAIAAARTARKEAKKIEALARKGLRPAPLPQPVSREWSEDSSDEDASDDHFGTEMSFSLAVPVSRTTQAPSIDDIDELAASVPATSRMSTPMFSKTIRASVAPVEKANAKGRAKTPSAGSRKPTRKTQPLIEGNGQPSKKKARARQKRQPSGLAAEADTPVPDSGELADTLAARETTEPRAEDSTQQSNEDSHARQENKGPSFPEIPDTPAIDLEESRSARPTPQAPTQPLAKENVLQSMPNFSAGQRGHPSALGDSPGYSFVWPTETAETPAPEDSVEPVVEPLGQKNDKKPGKNKSGLAERAPAPPVRSEETAGTADQEDQTEPAGIDPKSNKKARKARKSKSTERAALPDQISEGQSKAPIHRNLALPLAEVAGQHLNTGIGSNIEQPGSGPAKKAIASTPNSLDQADSAQENDVVDRRMTRHQQRKAQIQRMDQMAQEAMEMEEA